MALSPARDVHTHTRSTSITEALAAACRAFAHRPALSVGTHILSYSELQWTVDALARQLPNRSGRVMLQMRASAPSALLFYALLKAGSVPVVADPEWPDSLALRMARELGCAYLIADHGTTTEGRALSALGVTGARLRELPIERAACATACPSGFIRFTSGSSGVPKAILFSEGAALRIGGAWARAARMAPGDRVLCLATFNNGLAFNTSLLSVFLSGGQVEFGSPNKIPTQWARAAERLRPTVFVGFPTAYSLLGRHAHGILRRGLADTRLFLSSAATLSPAINAEWHELFGRHIGNYYGLAETGPITFNDGSDATSLGRLLPGVRLRVESPDPSGAGRFAILTPWRGSGYCDDIMTDA